MAQRKQYPLRIDSDVWAAVQAWAADDFRSVNAQVEWILRDALRRAGRLSRTENPSNSESHDGDRQE